MTKLRVKVNRTNKYLWPCVNLFGRTFLKELNGLTNYVSGYQIGQSVLFTSIGDVLYYRAKGFEIKELLFVVFDTRGCYNDEKDMYINVEKGKTCFKDFLKYIRTNKHYEDDYWYDSNQHCVVFNLESLSKVYWNFFYSKYSKMYSKTTLKEIGITPKKYIKGKQEINPEYAVLIGDAQVGWIQLKTKIYESFGVDIVPDNPDEFDIPWFLQEEFLNYEYITEEESQIIKSIKNGNRTEVLSC